MRRPRIGIPLTLDDRGRWRRGRRYHYIDRSYADAVVKAGGLPLQLPIQPDAHELMSVIDGLLLPGGDDFLPEDTLPEGAFSDGSGASPGTRPLSDVLDPVSAEQLAFDRSLVEAARARELPILGICYGMQLLGLLAGGALHFHLPGECPDAGEHGSADPETRHPIRIEPSSRLAAALGCRRCEVNSLHHQALRSVGPGHRVVARSPDGVIEAIESLAAADGGRGWELGVQWHPEKWHPEKLASRESDRLFRHFVEACEAASGRGRQGAA